MSAIGTIIEPSGDHSMLLRLPDGYQPEQVRDAPTAKTETLPDSVRRTLNARQGLETRGEKQAGVDADIDIAQPLSPWRRRTDGLSEGNRPVRARAEGRRWVDRHDTAPGGCA